MHACHVGNLLTGAIAAEALSSLLVVKITPSLCGLPAAQQVIPVHAAQTSCDCAVQDSQTSSRSYWTRSVASKRNANPLAVEQIWVSFRTSAMHRVEDSATVLHVAGLLAENISTSNSEPPRLGVMKDLPARGR